MPEDVLLYFVAVLGEERRGGVEVLLVGWQSLLADPLDMAAETESMCLYH